MNLIGSGDGTVGFPVDFLYSRKGTKYRTQIFDGDTQVCDTPSLLPYDKGCQIRKPGKYRLLADVTQATIPTSSHTTTEWTLNIDRINPSRSDKAAEVPLVLADYRLPVDSNTFAPADDHKVPIHIGYQRGGPAAAKAWTVKAWATFDDGKTWKPVYDDQIGSDGWFSPKIEPSEGHNGYVGLRVQAEDGKGNTLNQTIIRAYTLAADNMNNKG